MASSLTLTAASSGEPHINDNTTPRPAACAREPGPTVKVVFPVERNHGYTAVVEVCGEHDVANANDIDQALRGLDGSVLVDLTECSFVDSTVIGVLLDDVRVRNRKGQRLDLLVPAANTEITRTLKIMGVGELLSIHETWSPPG